MKIAFIGLGNMGGGMAANLVAAGHEVHAFDLSAAALARAAENGCTPHTTVAAAVAVLAWPISRTRRLRSMSTKRCMRR